MPLYSALGGGCLSGTKALAACLILIATEALYLVGANVFLRSNLFDSVVNENPNRISVKTEKAYSLFPGWVKAARIQVRGQDPDVQWLVEVEDASVWVSLPDLLFGHAFHVHRVDAAAGLFQLRTRTLPARPSGDDFAELPPIPGFDRDTLLKVRSDEENRTNDQKNKAGPRPDTGLRQVRIDNVHIPGFKEIWVGVYRFDGKIDVSGSFTLRLGHQLEISAGRLGILSGTLVRQGRSIAQNLKGLIDAKIRNYQLDRESVLDIFKTLSAEVSLEGELDSLDPITFLLRSQDWLRVHETQGNFSVVATVQEGQLKAIQSAALKAEHFLASFSHFWVQGDASLSLKINRAGNGLFEFLLPGCRIMAEKDREPILNGKNLKLVLESPDLELVHLYKRVLARVSLPESQVASFGFLNRWIPLSSGFFVQEGSGRVSADFAVSNYAQTQTPAGNVSFSADHLLIKKGKNSMVGDVQLKARMEQVFHEANALKEIKISEGELRVTGASLNALKPWTADVKVIEGFIRPDVNPQITARLSLHLPDVAPFLGEFGIQAGMGKFAQDLLLSGDFKGNTDLTLGDHWIDLDHMKLDSDGARMQGLLHLRGKTKLARAIVHYGLLNVGVQLDDDETQIHLMKATEWYERAALTSGQARPFQKHPAPPPEPNSSP